MSNKLSVVAAIPNYNMAESLGKLLPEVISQGYNEVFLLDDASTDKSIQTAMQFGTSVTVVEGTENVGAGANRNRILDALGYEAIIHFLDADTELITPGIPEVARSLFTHDNIGFIGGLVLEADGKQNAWNYGPRQCLYTDIGASLHYRLQNGRISQKWGQLFPNLLRDWPDPSQEPQERAIFWILEANMLIRSSTFKQLGGFDPTIREHDIQDLAIKAYKTGLVSSFTPSLAVSHKNVEVRDGNRVHARDKAEWYLARKYGLRNWFLPDGRFKPRYNQ